MLLITAKSALKYRPCALAVQKDYITFCVIVEANVLRLHYEPHRLIVPSALNEYINLRAFGKHAFTVITGKYIK